MAPCASISTRTESFSSSGINFSIERSLSEPFNDKPFLTVYNLIPVKIGSVVFVETAFDTSLTAFTNTSRFTEIFIFIPSKCLLDY